jgi:2'-5' RNA ligase
VSLLAANPPGLVTVGVPARRAARLEDDFAALVDAELDQVTAAAARALHPTTSGPDDLAGVRAAWGRRVGGRLHPTLQLAWLYAAALVREQLRGQLPGLTAATDRWGDPPAAAGELAADWVNQEPRRLVGIGDDLWDAATRELRQGVTQGEGVAALRRRLQAASGAVRDRATQAARDQVYAALAAGTLTQAQAAGVPGTKTWISMRDNRVRPTHAPRTGADGQTVALGEVFVVGGWPAQRPHDPALPAEEAAGCRCVVEITLDTRQLGFLTPDASGRGQATVDRRIRAAVDGGALQQGWTVEDLADYLDTLDVVRETARQLAEPPGPPEGAPPEQALPAGGQGPVGVFHPGHPSQKVHGRGHGRTIGAAMTRNGVPKPVAKRVQESIDDLNDRYHEVTGYAIGRARRGAGEAGWGGPTVIMAMDARGGARNYTGGTLLYNEHKLAGHHINTRTGRPYQAPIDQHMAASVADGWSVPGSERVEGVVTHEFGHLLFTDPLRTPDIDRAKLEATYAARKAGRPDRKGWGLSEYAATDQDEADAELFANYHWGGRRREPWVQVWGERFHRELGIDPTPMGDGAAPVDLRTGELTGAATDEEEAAEAPVGGRYYRTPGYRLRPLDPDQLPDTAQRSHPAGHLEGPVWLHTPTWFHLPGRHDQGRHGKGHGTRVGAAMVADGVDPEVAARVQEAVNDWNDRYHDVTRNAINEAIPFAPGDPGLDAGATMAMDDAGRLWFNHDHFTEPGGIDARLQRAVGDGLLVPGDGRVEGVVAHEGAHLLLHHPGRSDKVKLAHIQAHAAARRAGRPPEWEGELSTYATTPGPEGLFQEADAELFASYHWGGPTRRPWVRAWGETFHRELGIDPTPLSATREGPQIPGQQRLPGMGLRAAAGDPGDGGVWRTPGFVIPDVDQEPDEGAAGRVEWFHPGHASQKVHGRKGTDAGGAGPPVLAATSWDQIQDGMGFHEPGDAERLHPERYAPNKGFGQHLKEGQVETRYHVADGKPELYDVTPLPAGMNVDEGRAQGLTFVPGSGVRPYHVVPGSQRPPPHVFRAVSEADYQRMRSQGLLDTDGRANLAAAEGMVTEVGNPVAYLPSTGQGRILRIRYDPADGWSADPADEYVKAGRAKIPFGRVDLVSPVIDRERTRITGIGDRALAASVAVVEPPVAKWAAFIASAYPAVVGWALQAAAAGGHDGAMIALVPTRRDARELALPQQDAEPADTLHLTLAYLGDAADWTPHQQQLLVALFQALAEQLPPDDVDVFGVGHWNPDSEPCWVLNLGGEGLDMVHGTVWEILRNAEGEVPLPELPTQHAPWVPHIALAYSDDAGLLTEVQRRAGSPVTFDRLRIAFGDRRIDLKLAGRIDSEEAAHAHPFHGQHDQSRHGRRWGTTVNRSMRTKGGITIHRVSGAQPTKGLALSPYPDRETVLALKDVDRDHVQGFLKRNRDLLAKPDHFVGGWLDRDTGKAYLDVSVLAKDKASAERLARKHKQLAYFDLASGEEVRVAA